MDSLAEGGSTGEGGGLSPRGEASSHTTSAKEGATPTVPKFVPEKDIVFPPVPLDKTRSYFCAPELSYGVCCNLVTPKDRAHLHSKGLKGIRNEGMNKQFQVLLFFASSLLFHYFLLVFEITLRPCAEHGACEPGHIRGSRWLYQKG